MTEPITPGVYRLRYWPGNPHNGLLHVRAIVDEEWVVYRQWRRLRWDYRIEHTSWFEIRAHAGHLQRVRDEIEEQKADHEDSLAD